MIQCTDQVVHLVEVRMRKKLGRTTMGSTILKNVMNLLICIHCGLFYLLTLPASFYLLTSALQSQHQQCKNQGSKVALLPGKFFDLDFFWKPLSKNRYLRNIQNSVIAFQIVYRLSMLPENFQGIWKYFSQSSNFAGSFQTVSGFYDKQVPFHLEAFVVV